jgi:hypothetical protein
MSPACTSQPISWLTLERYHLGELSPAESGRVETHLGECPVCWECMRSIRDQTFSLPPLPEPKPRGARLRWAFASVGLVVAAVLAVVLATHDWEKTTKIPGNRIAYKGGELSVSLVRERQGEILHEPTTFAPGDRFKILVTCPPGEELPWDLVVFQDNQASFPYTPEGALTCGNRVPLAGAFHLTGQSRAVICLLLGSAVLDRPSSIEELFENSVCLELDPIAL